MCNIDESSFVFKLFEEVKKKIRFKKEFGEIQLEYIPLKIQHSGKHTIRMAMGTTYTKLKQSHGINFNGDIIIEKSSISPGFTAGVIIQMSFQLSKKIAGLKPAKQASDFGNKRVYWNILDAVLSLFLSKLAEIESNKCFDDKISSLEQLIGLHEVKPAEGRKLN